MLRLSRLMAATVVRYAFAMEYSVSPDFTRWRTTDTSSLSFRRSTWDDLVAGGFATAVSVFGRFVLARDETTSASGEVGEMGRWRASTLRPRRLSLCRPFQRRSICAETPKLSATDSTVSPLRTLYRVMRRA